MEYKLSQDKLIKCPEKVRKTITSYRLARPLGFGINLAPVMTRVEYKNDRWGSCELLPCEAFLAHPAMKAFHYGQQIFEGMKAYRQPASNPYLFRPELHSKRFNQSAIRMAMPEIPEDLFLQAIYNLVHQFRDHIPCEAGESLYLRPLMIASSQGLHLSSSDQYLFFVLASPSASYFSASEVHALIERHDSRASPGGTGAVKAAGNYGGSIRSSLHAKALGFQQTLWLDAVTKKHVEEFSGMNFFARIDDTLITPPLNSSILPGITRDSLITIARHLKIDCREEAIDIDDLLAKISDGTCKEIFACGTAAVITPIAGLADQNQKKYPLSYSHSDLMWRQLLDELLRVQTGSGADPFSWRKEVQLGN